MGAIAAGDVVTLADGVYKLTAGDVKSWIAKGFNVKYRGTKWKTQFDFRGLAAPQLIQFDGAHNVEVSGVSFDNARLVMRNCNNHLITSSSFYNTECG